MKLTLTMSRTEAEQTFSRAMGSHMPDGFRVTSVEWTSYGSRIEVEATNDPPESEEAPAAPESAAA